MQWVLTLSLHSEGPEFSSPGYYWSLAEWLVEGRFLTLGKWLRDIGVEE